MRPSYPSGSGPALARRLFSRHRFDGSDDVLQLGGLTKGAVGWRAIVPGLWCGDAGRIREENGRKSCPLLLWVSLPARRRRLGRHAYVCR